MPRPELDKDAPGPAPHEAGLGIDGSDSRRRGRPPSPDGSSHDDQPAPSRSTQEQMTDYPGIKGPKVRDLEQDDAMDKHEAEQVKDSADTKVDADDVK